MDERERPLLIIGGSGGSGTRVVQRMAEHAGYFMGVDDRLNRARDAAPLFPIFGWAGEVLTGWLAGDLRITDKMRREYAHGLDQHLEGAPAGPWGWKLPTSMLVLPFLHEHHGHMRFIHVVRDGRDMALSRIKHELKLLGDLVLDEPHRGETRMPIRAARFWTKMNMLAADYAEQSLGDGYLRIVFEDMVARPEMTARRIFTFIDGDTHGLRAAVAAVDRPPTMGRWKDQPRALRREIDEICAPALRRFGYDPGYGPIRLVGRDLVRGTRAALNKGRRTAGRIKRTVLR